MKIGGAGEFKGEKKLLKMEFDVDSDGDDDLLISTTMLTDGKAGTIWHVYLREGDTFRWISGSATLRRDACRGGHWDAWKRNVVASYWPNGVENGSWHAVYVKDDKIVDVPLDIEKKGPITDFKGLKKIVPEEFLFDDLKEKYEAPAKQEPKPTGAATDEANGRG